MAIIYILYMHAYIRIVKVGNTFQIVNSPLMIMSASGNVAKLGAAHSDMQIAQVVRPWMGSNLLCV